MVSGVGGSSPDLAELQWMKLSVNYLGTSLNGGTCGPRDFCHSESVNLLQNYDGSESGGPSCRWRGDHFPMALNSFDLIDNLFQRIHVEAEDCDALGWGRENVRMYHGHLERYEAASYPKSRVLRFDSAKSISFVNESHCASSGPEDDDLLSGFGLFSKIWKLSDTNISPYTDDMSTSVEIATSSSDSRSGARPLTTTSNDGGLPRKFEGENSGMFPDHTKDSLPPNSFMEEVSQLPTSEISPVSFSFTDDDDLLPGFSPLQGMERDPKAVPTTGGDLLESFSETISATNRRASTGFGDLLGDLDDPGDFPRSRYNASETGHTVNPDWLGGFDSSVQSPHSCTRASPSNGADQSTVREGLTSTKLDMSSGLQSYTQIESRQNGDGSGSTEQLGNNVAAWDFSLFNEFHVNNGTNDSSTVKGSNDAWLTIDDVVLVTLPSTLRSPSRPPPRLSGTGSGFKGSGTADFRDSVSHAELVTFSPSSSTLGGPGTRIQCVNEASASKAMATVNDWDSMLGIPSNAHQNQPGELGPESASEVSKISTERKQHKLHDREERAAKAIADMNQRDLKVQHDQELKRQAGSALDAEIKRWAAGKDGNLRSQLSNLQYILWSECGWTPVALTDLITPASVKKVYRKAILCVHPDKLHQKGTAEQKYIAERVFDLLNEAFRKFNAEELSK